MTTSDKECNFCGVSFTPKRSDAKFCSDSCKQKAYLSRKHEEIGDMQKQLDGFNRQTTDSEDRISNNSHAENNTDSREFTNSPNRHFTDNASRQFTEAVTDNSGKMTENLRLIEAGRPSMTDKASNHFTGKEFNDNDPFRLVEVTIKGRKVKMTKFTYDCCHEDGFENCEFYDSEEEYHEAERKAALKKTQSRWSEADKRSVAETNEHLKDWIKTLFSFKRIAIYREVKELIANINDFKSSYHYRYLPEGYEYKSIIELTILPALKKLTIEMEVSRTKRIKVEISAEREAQLMDVLLQIS